jgi:hypothetical protein
MQDIVLKMYSKYGEDLIPQHIIDDFASVRARVLKAVEAGSGPITFEDALKQIKLFKNDKK